MLLETGGHRSIEDVPPGVVRIVDVKCPGSGEAGRMDWTNLARLTASDQVKFVIKDRVDYEYARDIVGANRWPSGWRRCCSRRSTGVLEARPLAEWQGRTPWMWSLT